MRGAAAAGCLAAGPGAARCGARARSALAQRPRLVAADLATALREEPGPAALSLCPQRRLLRLRARRAADLGLRRPPAQRLRLLPSRLVLAPRPPQQQSRRR